jgi:hypothetical protein
VLVCVDTPLGEGDVMDSGVRFASAVFPGSMSAVCGVLSRDIGLRMAGRLQAHYVARGD